jgi:hypothetical protein
MSDQFNLKLFFPYSFPVAVQCFSPEMCRSLVQDGSTRTRSNLRELLRDAEVAIKAGEAFRGDLVRFSGSESLFIIIETKICKHLAPSVQQDVSA